MFEKFTERARKVMSLSRQEAQARNNDFIGTEHMLIAMLREDGGVAAKMLKKLGMTLANVIPEIDKITPPSTTPSALLGQLPFTPRVKHAIVAAGEEASRSSADVVGTEHLLLGLFLENDGPTAMVFSKFDVTEHGLRRELREILGDQADTVSPSSPNPRTGSIRVTLYKPFDGTLGVRFLVVGDIKYCQAQTITLEGIPEEKRHSVAQAIARDMGCPIYTVEPVFVADQPS